MYTAAEVDAIRDRMQANGASKAEIIQAISADCLGWPYVFGAWGCMCTPGNRKKYADLCEKKHPEYAEKIRRACPVLCDRASRCDQCGWQGVRCFDCRGFPHWLLEQVGLQLYGDTVGTQWETKSNWAVQGDIADMPADLVCCIFRKGHTGMYLGGGITRHCSTIVKEEPMPGRPNWMQFGIPAGLYSTEELRKAGLDVSETKNIPTLRRGSKGELVKSLQEYLNDEIGAGLKVDGVFGARTEAMVQAFQEEHGLTADGVVGPKTWAAMGGAPDKDEMPEESADAEKPEQDEGGETVAVPKAMLEAWADALEDMALDIRGYCGYDPARAHAGRT